MDYELPTWLFAGDLIGAVSIANDLNYTRLVRSVLAERAQDLLDHWLIADDVCKRM